MENKKYDHQKIENKWREVWEKTGIYKTPEDVKPQNKFYILPQLPYPSGAGLHIGHTEVYTGCDVYARYQRMKGKDVLQVVGWDSFGLPAENYAIKTNVHPRISTKDAIDNFREQIKSLGVSVDWDREVGSHNPDYYKFTQWFFKLMYDKGLAYREKQIVNWCETDQTVLANEQVEPDGTCERCGTKIELKEMEQWYFRITDYADRLDEDLDKVDWPAESVKRQRDWIGKSIGAEIDFKLTESDLELKVFTTAHDTIFGATFMVIAPEHEILKEIQAQVDNWSEVEAYIQAAQGKTELQRQQQKDKTGIELKGIKAINPVNNQELPIFVADYVLVGYGTGAIMAVPAHDERDMEFAKKYNLDIIFVVESSSVDNFVSYSSDVKSNLNGYKIINSGEFDGNTFAEARPAILKKLESMGQAEAKIQYKLRDWSISRQRFWGAPIPVVFDPEGNIHLVADEDLPVKLPDDVDFKPTGQSPLTYSEEFHSGVEEKYGKGWRREVDTLDTFMCSSWYFFRYIDPHNQNEFASQEALKTWMPVDYYLGGPEHVNGHLLYSRFFTKVLYDAGYIDFDEPFMVHRHQGMISGEDGRKMSKRWGNVINPTDVVNEYGADTARTYLMFMGPLEQDKSWNQSSAVGVRKFIERVYRMNAQYSDMASDDVKVRTHELVKFATEGMESQRFNVVIAKLMETMNLYEEKLPTRSEWDKFILVLAPFAPFITEQMFSENNEVENITIHKQGWPTFDDAVLANQKVDLAVQINGKTRAVIKVSPDTQQSDAEDTAKQDENIAKYLEGKSVVKTIFVPGRILNFVVKG